MTRADWERPPRSTDCPRRGARQRRQAMKKVVHGLVALVAALAWALVAGLVIFS